jgi:hypothetical protein
MGSASIEFDPADPVRGEKCIIRTTGIPEGTEIKLEWNPPGQPDSVTVGADGTVSFTVPQNAETVIATEPKSGAEAAAVVVDA